MRERGHGQMEPDPDTVFEELLTPAEVANYFKCDPKTVTRWARAGRLSSIRTVGGHRRYSKSEVLRLVADSRRNRQEKEGR
jgi:excisionase family DNA binding protein